MPNIYQLNDRDEIIAKLSEIPTGNTNYCLSDIACDFDNYIIVIGAMDENHNVTYQNPPKERPYHELVEKLNAYKAANNALKADNERTASALIDLMNLVTGGA
jgi:hypothetical protein